MKKLKNIFISILALLLIIGCQSESADVNSPDTGVGGSLAKFTVVDNYLYTVYENGLKLYSLQDPNNPSLVKDIKLGFGIETIFPLDTLLFLGTQSGMEIYDIRNPGNPIKISSYWHITSCDPVVVQDKYAYVTLHTETWCGRNTNELQVINIAQLTNPVEIGNYPLTKPLGLGINDTTLFVCDDGLKIFSAKNPQNLKLIKSFPINARDVIPLNDLLIVVGSDGIYQYSYASGTITLLSKLSATNSL